MYKRVIISSINDLKKSKKKRSFIINKPTYQITPSQEQKELQNFMKNMRADRVANIPKGYYSK